MLFFDFDGKFVSENEILSSGFIFQIVTRRDKAQCRIRIGV
ncbi:hypothetical protein ROSINTL182_09573 [Roseburia intestinalis L1-82]|uniref:Uncharacterized protein n=1 Tax=Roseburia intestinalis L1-82 TaxID=536231 RepID=C7GI01_9FIRM|nr:hypothetical protein ROSINTL182_09573 [Roseburia intestinalis L1-82]